MWSVKRKQRLSCHLTFPIFSIGIIPNEEARWNDRVVFSNQNMTVVNCEFTITCDETQLDCALINDVNRIKFAGCARFMNTASRCHVVFNRKLLRCSEFQQFIRGGDLSLIKVSFVASDRRLIYWSSWNWPRVKGCNMIWYDMNLQFGCLRELLAFCYIRVQIKKMLVLMAECDWYNYR